MRLKVLIAVTSGLLLAGDAATQDAKADKEKLQGTWMFAALERNGKKAPDEVVKKGGQKVTFKGDKMTVERDGKTVSEGAFSLNPAKKPKAIDFIGKDKDGKDATVLGIYELDGDTLKVCMSRPGSERPTEFATKEGDNRRLEVYKRGKP